MEQDDEGQLFVGSNPGGQLDQGQPLAVREVRPILYGRYCKRLQCSIPFETNLCILTVHPDTINDHFVIVHARRGL